MVFNAAEAVVDLGLEDTRFNRGIARTIDTLGKVRAGMERVGRQARRMLLIGGGAIGGFIALQAQQEASEVSVRAALRETGQEVENNLALLKRQASEIQAVTKFGDEFVLTLQAQAISLGVSADKVDEVVRASIGLSRVTQQDLNQSLRNMILATQGQFTMLQRYIPALRNTQDETEKLAIVNRLAQQGFRQVQEETQTTAGQFAQLKNSLGDVGEEIGAIFAPKVTEIATRIRQMLPDLQNWIKNNSDVIFSLVATAAKVGVILALLPTLTAAIAFLATPIGFVIAAIIGLGTAFLGAERSGGIFTRAIQKIATDLGILNRETNKLLDPWQQLPAFIDRGTEALREATRLADLGDRANPAEQLAAIEAAIREIEAAEQQVQRVRERRPGISQSTIFQQEVAAVNTLRSQLEALRSERERLRESLRNIGQATGEVGGISKQMEDAFEAWKKQNDEIERGIKLVEEFQRAEDRRFARLQRIQDRVALLGKEGDEAERIRLEQERRRLIKDAREAGADPQLIAKINRGIDVELSRIGARGEGFDGFATTGRPGGGFAAIEDVASMLNRVQLAAARQTETDMQMKAVQNGVERGIDNALRDKGAKTADMTRIANALETIVERGIAALFGA